MHTYTHTHTYTSYGHCQNVFCLMSIFVAPIDNRIMFMHIYCFIIYSRRWPICFKVFRIIIHPLSSQLYLHPANPNYFQLDYFWKCLLWHRTFNLYFIQQIYILNIPQVKWFGSKQFLYLIYPCISQGCKSINSHFGKH